MRVCIPLDTWFFIPTALQQQLKQNYLSAWVCCRLISHPISESCWIHFMMIIKISCRILLLCGHQDLETCCLCDLCTMTLNCRGALAACNGHCPINNWLTGSSDQRERLGASSRGRSWHKNQLRLQLPILN